jgi:hypothetical protein
MVATSIAALADEPAVENALPLLEKVDCSGMQTVCAPLPDSFDAPEESVFLMHVAADRRIVQ